MNNKFVTTMIGSAALTGAAYAGEVASEAPVPTCESYTCDALKSLGKVYKDKSNPWIQEVKLFGRAQFQYGYVDGSTDVSEGYSEWRRLRAGASVKFLKYFDAKVRANLEDGGANNHQIEFGGYDEAYFGFRADKAFNLGFVDKAHLTYGRHKISIGEDVHTSSKKIKTVERTALTGKVRPDNNVGGRLKLEKGDWKGAFGIFGADEGDDRALFDDFEGGPLFYLSSTHKLQGGDLIFDLIINGDDDVEDADYNNNWASSLAYRTELWNWDWAFNAVLGDAASNNEDRDGLFGGLVIQPSKFIWEDKLEFVGRYYFQLSEEEEGIRTNSRYNRVHISESGDGRGDMHHSVYAGLNYYLCGDRAKVMTGVEYETLDTPEGSENATTLWAAFRMYF